MRAPDGYYRLAALCLPKTGCCNDLSILQGLARRHDSGRATAGTLQPGFHPFPRKSMNVIAGHPAELGSYQGQPLTAAAVRAATADIMHAIAGLVGELRGESPPAESHDHHEAIEQRRATAPPS